MINRNLRLGPVSAMVIAAAILVAGPGEGWAQTKLSVGMPTSPPNIVHMPMYVAKDLGLYKAAGLDVIENRCPKIERQRLFGELRKAGFNTGVISSKL